MAQSIYFVGLMAVGKTSIGRHLATSLQRDFFDSDQVIEERAGVPIAWIFDVEGEQAFRDREQAVIDELTGKEGIVLATERRCRAALSQSAGAQRPGLRGAFVQPHRPAPRTRRQGQAASPCCSRAIPRETLEQLWQDRKPPL